MASGGRAGVYDHGPSRNSRLTAAALRLPTDLRARLAERLLASLNDEAERVAHAAAWDAEFDRREAAAEADPARAVPAAEAFGALRADLRELADGRLRVIAVMHTRRPGYWSGRE